MSHLLFCMCPSNRRFRYRALQRAGVLRLCGGGGLFGRVGGEKCHFGPREKAEVFGEVGLW